LIHLLYIFREHVNLVGLLDYEIWKASHMLAKKLPHDKDNDSQKEEYKFHRLQKHRDTLVHV